MKPFQRYILIFLSPFLFMILINECIRPTIKEEGYVYSGIKAINSKLITPEKCTWNCHNATDYCKENHVKLSPAFIEKSDPLYFGLIMRLRAQDKYVINNIIYLITLWPLLMMILLIIVLNLRKRIKSLKTN